MSQPLIVTAAIIMKDNKVLITRRPAGSRDAGKWEFPGGKLNSNEAPEQCLRRELLEELDLPVQVDNIFQVIHHQYSWGAVLLLFYECTPLNNEIKNLQVAEHRYVSIKELDTYDLLEADRPVIVSLQSLK